MESCTEDACPVQKSIYTSKMCCLGALKSREKNKIGNIIPLLAVMSKLLLQVSGSSFDDISARQMAVDKGHPGWLAVPGTNEHFQ